MYMYINIHEHSPNGICTNRNLSTAFWCLKSKGLHLLPALSAHHSHSQKQSQLCSFALPWLGSPVSLPTYGFAINPAHGPSEALPILLRYLEAEKTGYISQLI